MLILLYKPQVYQLFVQTFNLQIKCTIKPESVNYLYKPQVYSLYCTIQTKTLLLNVLYKPQVYRLYVPYKPQVYRLYVPYKPGPKDYLYTNLRSADYLYTNLKSIVHLYTSLVCGLFVLTSSLRIISLKVNDFSSPPMYVTLSSGR